jgi:hypothetical protein
MSSEAEIAKIASKMNALELENAALRARLQGAKAPAPAPKGGNIANVFAPKPAGRQCRATATKTGEPCRCSPQAGSDYCYNHRDMAKPKVCGHPLKKGGTCTNNAQPGKHYCGVHTPK